MHLSLVNTLLAQFVMFSQFSNCCCISLFKYTLLFISTQNTLLVLIWSVSLVQIKRNVYLVYIWKQTVFLAGTWIGTSLLPPPVPWSSQLNKTLMKTSDWWSDIILNKTYSHIVNNTIQDLYHNNFSFQVKNNLNALKIPYTPTKYKTKEIIIFGPCSFK